MPRGGRRSGTQGKAYTNRSDLTQAPRAATGQEYGKAGAQIQAQKAAPLPQIAPPPLVPINAETTMPGEPVTAGLPIGSGPGPSQGGAYVDPLDVLGELYRRDPNEDLRHLLALHDSMKRMGQSFRHDDGASGAPPWAGPDIRMPGTGAGRMVEPNHPGGEDFPIPGHMPPRRGEITAA
jgi:hypothetical protein